MLNLYFFMSIVYLIAIKHFIFLNATKKILRTLARNTIEVLAENEHRWELWPKYILHASIY